MAPRLSWPGLVAYLGIAGVMAVQGVRIVRYDEVWVGGNRWAAGALLVIVALTALLFVVGAMTRTPLVGDDTRVLGRRGGLAVIALTLLGLAIVVVSGLDAFKVWPSWMAIFVPYGVRKYEDAYREGVEEGRLVAEALREERER
ncbi:hypothetical protein FB561_3068 [Kribbella amoyensis]|uniref:Uncharacterized protein n=1 Tax=Kribbella amoyensis TaxID=996641 RepID=A0A561BST4_9ACTN|nr:hypothetical protein [Kribbella amoyensis]TWD81944.1 hypothetical protein FB561_3068 [Kribbella amoyensis]